MSTLATDDFNRANASDLGPNWGGVAGFTNISIVSNHAVGVGGSDFCQVYTAFGNMGVDHWAQCTVNGADRGGTTVRGSIAAGTFYLLLTEPTQTRIFAVIAGGFSLVASNGTTWSNGDIAYLEVQGTSLAVKKNGSTVLTGTDSSINGTSFGGELPGQFFTGTTATADDWSAGDFAGGAAQVPYRPSYPALASWPPPSWLHQRNTQQGKIAPLIPAPSPFTPGARAGTIYPAILLAYQDAIPQIELVASGVTAQDATDQPPRQFALAPQTMGQIAARWAQTWPAQSAAPNASWNIPPVLVELPHVPQPPAFVFVAAWTQSWSAQRAAPNAGWNVPPILVVLPHVAPPQSIWTSWVPPFVAPPRPVSVAPMTLVYGAQPPPQSPLSRQNLMDITAAWVQTWGAQHGSATAPTLPPPPVITFRPAWSSNTNRAVGF